MVRITKTNLISEIEDVNNILKESGSSYRYNYQSRNNYHAVDLERFEGDCFKTISCLDCAEPPKVLILKLLNDYRYYLGEG